MKIIPNTVRVMHTKLEIYVWHLMHVSLSHISDTCLFITYIWCMSLYHVTPNWSCGQYPMEGSDNQHINEQCADRNRWRMPDRFQDPVCFCLTLQYSGTEINFQSISLFISPSDQSGMKIIIKKSTDFILCHQKVHVEFQNRKYKIYALSTDTNLWCIKHCKAVKTIFWFENALTRNNKLLYV